MELTDRWRPENVVINMQPSFTLCIDSRMDVWKGCNISYLSRYSFLYMTHSIKRISKRPDKNVSHLYFD